MQIIKLMNMETSELDKNGRLVFKPPSSCTSASHCSTIEFTDGCPGRGCQICGDPVETRFGACFRCADAESVIATGEDMFDKKVAETPMEKLKYILHAYGITSGLVGQSHDYCECGTRHDFDVPPGTEKTYACECGRLMCHRTVS